MIGVSVDNKSNLRMVGGAIAIIGGVIYTLYSLILFTSYEGAPIFIGGGISVIVGGVALIEDKKWGGFLASVGAATSIALPLAVTLLSPDPESRIKLPLDFFIIVGIAALGGLLGLLAPSSSTPSPAIPAVPTPPPASIRSCPICGTPLTYIPQYQRYYCYSCQKYP